MGASRLRVKLSLNLWFKFTVHRDIKSKVPKMHSFITMNRVWTHIKRYRSVHCAEGEVVPLTTEFLKETFSPQT